MRKIATRTFQASNHDPKLKSCSFDRTIGSISSTLLLFLLLALFCPVATNVTNAKDGSDYNKPAWIPSNYVSLSLGSMPAMDITPTGEGGSVGVSQASLKVSTTSNTGYKLYVSTLDHTTAMTSTDTNQSAAIASTNTIATASNLAPNTWGYTITDAVSDSTTYSPMPTTSTVAYDTAQASGEHYLSFAAKIDTSLPAGQYSNTVAISAIANPAVITGMMELTYMQDMTSSICHDTVGYDQNYNRDSNGSYIITPGSEVTKQLIDSRDGKEYWVAKLADGNCWMTQNLALNIDATKGLDPATSDLNGTNSGWTTANPGVDTDGIVKVAPSTTTATLYPPSTTPAPNTTGSWNFSKNMDNSWLLATPANQNFCGVSVSSLTECATAGLIELTDETKWRPTYTAQPGTWNGESQELVAIRPATNNLSDGGEYDAHYLLGNYYQWNTATAGSGGEIIDKDARDSICPKNWRLPTSNGTASGGFKNLLQRYDLEDQVTGIVNGVTYHGHTAPIYFVQNGHLSFSSNYYGLMYAGRIAGLVSSWAETYRTDVHQFYYSGLYYDYMGNHSRSRYGYVRQWAFPVRCLAR